MIHEEPKKINRDKQFALLKSLVAFKGIMYGPDFYSKIYF